MDYVSSNLIYFSALYKSNKESVACPLNSFHIFTFALRIFIIQKKVGACWILISLTKSRFWISSPLHFHHGWLRSSMFYIKRILHSLLRYETWRRSCEIKNKLTLWSSFCLRWQPVLPEKCVPKVSDVYNQFLWNGSRHQNSKDIVILTLQLPYVWMLTT